MSSAFLLTEALSNVLRKPYQQGDLDVTVSYLVEGLKIGEYRVMLKRNFDTACWVPPVGKRDSHSLYYGDRMLARLLPKFCEVEGITMPGDEVFVHEVQQALAIEKSERERLRLAGGKVPSLNPMHPSTRVLDQQLSWLKENTTKVQWARFGEMLTQAVAAYGRHEREHARNTPQNLKVINRDLKTLGIDFKYFNLFEDARIEHISRQDLGGQFEWLSFEELAPPTNPFNLFLRCIQLEGAPDEEALDSEEPYGKEEGRSLGHVADSVQSYYCRAIGCSSAEDLYPIIAEFLEEFKDDLPQSKDKSDEGGEGGGSGGGEESSEDSESDSGGGGAPDEDENDAEDRAGDLSTAAEAAEQGDEFFEDFDKDAEIIGGTDAEGKKAEAKAKAALGGKPPPSSKKGSPSQGVPESIAPQASGGRASEHDFLATLPGRVDEAYAKRVDHLTSMLMRMFKSHTLPAAMEIPNNRMSSRHLAKGELRWIRKKVFGGKGKRKYSIVYDCSGSMSGLPDREGKLLLLALNRLARMGYLEGQLVLSGWVQGRPGWLSYKFPVKDEIILRISPGHSAEGLQDSLKDNLKDIKGMDDVFVYTDACICDAPLNREYFARQRIWPVGLYVGPEERAKEMHKHFPQNIIRSNIEAVVEAMLTRNKRTVG